MVKLIFIIVLSLLMILSISLLKLYNHVPAKELKRQARVGDELAKIFYRVVSYGMSLQILLWFTTIITSSVLFVVLADSLAWPVALVVIILIVWLCFDFLPKSHVSNISVQVGKHATPVLHYLLERLQPLLRRLANLINKIEPVRLHTGLYTKGDIVDLIKKQKVQIDNRVTKEELYIVENALQFGDKKVSEIMTPRRVMKTVATHDMIGPVLLKELHDSGHSRFPVYDENPNDIVGTLYLRDALAASAGGFVKNVLRKEVFYVNQSQSLARVLDAFIKTKHHQFLVVNNFEEIVGLITIEDIIEQILGKQIIDEFDSYDDLRAVAIMEAEKDEAKRKKPVEEEPTTKLTAKTSKKDSPDEQTVVE